MLSDLNPEAFEQTWLRQRLRDGYAEFRTRRPWCWLPSWLRARVFAWWFLPADVAADEAVKRIRRHQLRKQERGNG